MELLPLMLHFAFFLLGCALSHYHWDIDTTIASVVLDVTSFGAVFYAFTAVAGIASVNCLYRPAHRSCVISLCLPSHPPPRSECASFRFLFRRQFQDFLVVHYLLERVERSKVGEDLCLFPPPANIHLCGTPLLGLRRLFHPVSGHQN